MTVLKSLRVILYCLCHPIEASSLLVLWWRGPKKLLVPSRIPQTVRGDWNWCYEKLIAVSRSFSLLVCRIHEDVRDPLCLFYLILRALDTVEDDMKVHVDTKKKHLIQFHTHLKTPGWNLIGYGNKKDEVDLLENFNRVINCFLKIEPEYQNIITDTCEKMGTGMAEFLERDVGTIQDLDDYCHYVAGIVGHGLSGLWIASGVGHFPNLLRDNDQTVPCQELLRLSNSVGLFLQKVNIIRDIVEDISETTPPRIFWPKDIWSKYVNRIEDLVAYKPIGCLNELITNSVRHVQDCLDYLKHFRSLTIPSETTVFSFVAVGTLMSMATLELCFNNDKVFQGTVKISRDETLRIMANADTYSTTLRLVIHYSERLLVKADLNIKENPEDSDSKFMQGVITELIRRCNKDMGEIDY